MSPRRNNGDSAALGERVVRVCLKMPSAEMTYPFGEETAVFKVGDKMFAVVSENEDPGRLTLKCDPDYGAYLTQQFDDIIPGYHMNKRHWITITLMSSLPEDLVEELISDSYELIIASLPRHKRQTIESLGRS